MRFALALLAALLLAALIATPAAALQAG